MGLRTGEKVSVHDLLYGLLLPSGNDAAVALAMADAGSGSAFVRKMNAAARHLGLDETHYGTPVGLDEPDNYSSAHDLATLTRHLLRIPAFAKIADSRQRRPDAALDPPRRIESINELLEDAPWITGVKTGHTFGALYVLVGSGRRKGIELISDAIGAPSDEDRFSDNLELLEYGFRQYRQRDTRSVPARTSPTPRSATPAASCRCAPRARVVARRPPRPEARGRRCKAPSRGRGADQARRRARPRQRPRRRRCPPGRCRCGPAARSPRRAASTASAASSATT